MIHRFAVAILWLAFFACALPGNSDNVHPRSTPNNLTNGESANSESFSQFLAKECSGSMQFSNESDGFLGEFAAWSPLSSCMIPSPFSLSICRIERLVAKEEMIRIHARRVVAFMQYPQADWDWSEVNYPRKTMRQNPSAAPIKHSIRISLIEYRSRPMPANIRISNGHELPEQVYVGWLKDESAVAFFLSRNRTNLHTQLPLQVGFVGVA